MIGYTLGVASPLTEGPRVKAAQQRLTKNVFKTDFHNGLVDGVFGETTGRSCKRAKYWLGYTTATITATFGPTLDAYLSGETGLPAINKVRIRQRRKAVPPVPLRARALAEAKRHLGVKESPAGSNKVFFSDWYGVVGPWCAMFVTYCHAISGSKAFVRGSRYAYVPYIVNDARAGRNGLQAIHDPEPGDVVCYDWNRDGVSDHTGLFEKWNVKGQSFDAIEGNTAVGNDSNGGQVMRRRRSTGTVQAFVRVTR